MFMAAPASNLDQNHDSSTDSGNVMHDDVLVESLQDMHESTDVTPLFNKTYQIMEKLSATHIGQFLLKRGDLVLRTFEETAKWRLSADNPDFSLLRPLPWIPFLMLIVVLRLLLMYLSIGALILGDEPVTAKKFIYFIQTRRRKLRSIRMHGLKAIQEREKKHHVQNVEAQQNSLMTKLSNLFSRFACRPSSHNDEVKAIAVTRDSGVEDEVQSNKGLVVPTAKTPANSKSPGFDASPLLSCKEMLNKFANQDSDEDSDYVPANEDDESVNDESYTSDTSDENAKDLSLTEKEQTKVKELPENSILIPAFEIKPVDANKTCKTDLKNNDDDHDNNVETIWADGMKTITMSPKTPLAPMDNGATNNGGLGAAVEVVQVQEIAKLQNALSVNLLNGHVEVQKKSTPGHETAAHSKPHLPPPLLGNIANASSPPDFSRFSTAIENPFLASINAEASPNGNHAVDVEEVFSESKHFKPNEPEPKSQNSKQQQQKYQQRHRNRNRR